MVSIAVLCYSPRSSVHPIQNHTVIVAPGVVATESESSHTMRSPHSCHWPKKIKEENEEWYRRFVTSSGKMTPKAEERKSSGSDEGEPRSDNRAVSAIRGSRACKVRKESKATTKKSKATQERRNLSRPRERYICRAGARSQTQRPG